MIINSIQTGRIEANKNSVYDIIEQSIISLQESTIITITSKVVSLCEGRVMAVDQTDKDDVIRNEADYYIPRERSKYDIMLTIKGSIILPSAGVDESNTNGYYVLWPEDPQKSANEIWAYLRRKYSVKNIGVLITDSTSSPLRWGVTGKSIAYCGFKGVNDIRGKSDVFGRPLKMTRINVADGLAAAAVVVMGESDERTPIALISDVPFVAFSDAIPTAQELEDVKIEMEDDLYGQLLETTKWEKKN